MKLYVKNVNREHKDSLYTFLSKILKLKGNYYLRSTVNSTFFDPEFKELQCIGGKHRSFDDLVLIGKTYFKVSDKAVAKVIKKLLNEDNTLSFVLCDTAKKWVLNKYLNHSETIKYCAKYNKSDLKIDDCGVGVYSFYDIIKLMGLTIEDIKIGNG